MPTRRFFALPADRQAHLLACAAEEFAEHGYESASFNRIIERAGVSKGAFYYYFEDKADLYATVVRDAVGRLIAACGVVTPPTDADDFWRQVHRTTAAAVRFYRTDPHIAGVVLSLARDGLRAGPVAEVRDASETWLSALIGVGQAVGAVRADLPMELMVRIGTAISEGFDLWLAEHVATLDDAALDHLVDQIVDLYRRIAAASGGR